MHQEQSTLALSLATTSTIKVSLKTKSSKMKLTGTLTGNNQTPTDQCRCHAFPLLTSLFYIYLTKSPIWNTSSNLRNDKSFLALSSSVTSQSVFFVTSSSSLVQTSLMPPTTSLNHSSYQLEITRESHPNHFTSLIESYNISHLYHTWNNFSTPASSCYS